MSVLSDYLEFDEVRAVFGVTDEELDDDTLSLNLYLYGLRGQLFELASSLNADFATVLAINPSARTNAETRFYEATRVFSVYAVAYELSVGSQNRVPKTITDGKASIIRFGDSPTDKSVHQKCKENYDKYKELLRSAYAAYLGESTSPVLFSFLSVSSPTTNEVTGS